MDFEIQTTDTGKTPFRFIKIAEEYLCDAMLLLFPDCTVLWDTDFACTAPFVIRKLKETLKNRPLDYILLSHSHYDHAAGAPYIQAAFPEARIIAAVHAAEVFRKESTRAKMLSLDNALAVRRGLAAAPEDVFSSIHADLAVKDNDLLMLGDHPVRIVETPGHTRDSLCFLFTEENILLGTETLGVYRPEGFGLAMLVGYGPTVSSINKIRTLPLRAIMPPHGAGIVFGETSCRSYLDAVLVSAEKTRDSIISVLEKGKWTEEAARKAVEMIVQTGDYYDPSMIKARELNGFLMVQQLYREFHP